MRREVAALLLVAAICPPSWSAEPKIKEAKPAEAKPTTPKAGEFPAETIQVGADERVYRLVVPATVDLQKPAPLVFAFHGFLVDSKDVMPAYTKLSDAAIKHRFILVYPNALDRSWALTPDKMTKDLAFFDALLKRLETSHKIDPDRVYVTGMSNGGYFAHYVGKERCQKVAAVACHSGALGLQTLLGIGSARKFPVMIIHGDQDQLISVNIARENRDKYRREGHEVLYVEVPGLSHWWGVDAKINDQIWKFFVDHPRPKQPASK